MNMFEFSNKILTLKKEDKYNEAIKFFKENKHNFSKKDISENKYIIASMLTCLRKANYVKMTYKFLEEYQIDINENSEELMLNAYGWAVHDNIKQGYIVKNQIIKAIEQLIFLLSLKSTDYSYSVISNLFRLGLKISKENQNQDFIFTNDFCNIFNESILSSKNKIYEDGDKSRTMASDREKWYCEKSKALYHLKDYKQCCELSEKALQIISKFTNNNDVWLTRRIALSHKELGNIDNAIEKLHSIYRKKNEWFIQKEIAELYFEKDELELAFKHCSNALNAKGKIEYKIDLIFLMANILKVKGEDKLAQKHFIFVKELREKHGWKIPEKVQEAINNETINITTNHGLRLELEKYWQTLISKQKLHFGIIKKILHDNEKGKDGFIKAEQKDHYFTLSSHQKLFNKISIDTEVKFEIVPSNNNKTKARIIEVV